MGGPCCSPRFVLSARVQQEAQRMHFNTRLIRTIVGVIILATMAGAIIHGARVATHWYYLPFIIHKAVANYLMSFINIYLCCLSSFITYVSMQFLTIVCNLV